MNQNKVRTGIDQLVADQFSFLLGKRVGLLTHAPACDSRLRPTLFLFKQALGDGLKVVFTPEHGFHAHAQDLEAVAIQGNQSLPEFISLYGSDEMSLHPIPVDLNKIDILVVDLVDVGSRYYTFAATMLYCMKAAFALGVQVVVLDRPNPIGCDLVEGPMLLEGWESFVGVSPIPIRHGLTIAEIAILFKEEMKLEGNLEVIPLEGYSRNLWMDETTVPWVMPSPNMPTLNTALVYPGQCLLEGTNLSEGRGTTRPFELFGAPWLDGDSLAGCLNSLELPGVVFRPVNFRPTFQKWQGQLCGGTQIHVTDRKLFRPVRTSLAVLEQLRKLDQFKFAWRTEPYEFVSDRLAIDLLFGSDRERLALEANVPWQEIAREWEEEESDFRIQSKQYHLYTE